ncbi:MAG: hypothetical protein K2X47_00120, partial [Bdellovibrionales bacterium]|nr:hypothetical protein [Bdellovibrionales bacterium]
MIHRQFGGRFLDERSKDRKSCVLFPRTALVLGIPRLDHAWTKGLISLIGDVLSSAVLIQGLGWHLPLKSLKFPCRIEPMLASGILTMLLLVAAIASGG